MSKVCQSMDDTSLSCGAVAANFNQRTTVNGNTANGSVKDGVITASGYGMAIYGNTLGNVRYGLRVRGTDSKHAVFGNTVNGATDGALIDGVGTQNAMIGNTFGGIKTANISVSNSSAFNNLLVANQLDGQLQASVPGVLNPVGGQNLIALNVANRFRGNAFDIRTTNNLVSSNLIGSLASGGVGVFLGPSSAYSLAFRNMCVSNSGNCFIDAGNSNQIAQNYSSGSPFTSITGSSVDNLWKGNTAGTLGLYTCTLVAGTCTILTTEVLSTDDGKIQCWRGSAGLSGGFPYESAIVAGTSFTVISTNASDTGNVTCRIIH
jgi:hypothetical protein